MGVARGGVGWWGGVDWFGAGCSEAEWGGVVWSSGGGVFSVGVEAFVMGCSQSAPQGGPEGVCHGTTIISRWLCMYMFSHAMVPERFCL